MGSSNISGAAMPISVGAKGETAIQSLRVGGSEFGSWEGIGPRCRNTLNSVETQFGVRYPVEGDLLGVIIERDDRGRILPGVFDNRSSLEKKLGVGQQ